jgi:hypothetical protein
LAELSARDRPRWQALLRDPYTGEEKLVDLRRLSLDHLRLPVLGAASLASVASVLALPTTLPWPEGPLHALPTPPDPLAARHFRQEPVLLLIGTEFDDGHAASGQSHFRFGRGLWRGMRPSIRPA